PRIRQRLVSRAPPSLTISLHQPDSPATSATWRPAEIPPSAATTGASAGPYRRQATRNPSRRPPKCNASGSDDSRTPSRTGQDAGDDALSPQGSDSGTGWLATPAADLAQASARDVMNETLRIDAPAHAGQVSHIAETPRSARSGCRCDLPPAADLRTALRTAITQQLICRAPASCGPAGVGTLSEVVSLDGCPGFKGPDPQPVSMSRANIGA